MITTAQAVMSLRPNVQWSMNGDDVEGIVWHTEGVKPLTTKEVQAEVKRLEAVAEAERKAREERKQSVIEKLGALGLTPDEVADVFGLEVSL